MKECVNCGALLEDGYLVCKYCSCAQDGSGEFHYKTARPSQQADVNQGAASVGVDPGAGTGPDAGSASGESRPNNEYRYRQSYPSAPPPGSRQYASGPRYRPVDRIVAGILAIVLGWCGIHKFYLGKIGQGIAMAVFFWTGVPFIIGIIEGIQYLCASDEMFREKYCRMY